MSRIFVSGAGGYFGIPLCQKLIHEGHVVTAMDRWFFGIKPFQNDTLNEDIRSINPSFLEGYDAVIDLAGLSNDATAEIDQDLTYSINIHGAVRLATLAKEVGVKHYIYSSSASVYGEGKKACLTETDECDPLTAYAKSKLSVERELARLSSGTFEPVILRNGTVFGVAQRMRLDLVLNIMTFRAYHEKLIYVMGGGNQFRPLVHISDVVSAFIFALGRKNETFNVSCGNFTINQLSGVVAQNMPHDVKIHHIPDDPDKRNYSISAAKLEKAGWRPTVNVHAGVKEIVEAIRNGTVTDDPTCYTLQWYKSLIEWNKRIEALKIDGKLF